eukprot:CAMPEP_0172306290 /NCGR_PEP_ID=MMETSP1058-20130122/7386_1 /TAXON_ID=83371 /ORGANISM="Detonula confervacea, Strain CCMP 353" /LENGTH=571 /DNA_ID=CAMNT_0013018123 /DNA_START=17 /DNA_END=1732 /DNA_ORIENTATION=+
MTITPYQGSGTAEAPLTPVSTVAASIPSHNFTRRRRSPSSPTTLSLPLSTELEEGECNHLTPPAAIGIGNVDSGMPMESPPSMPIDGRHVTMREMICNYVIGKSKVLIFGQLLSLLMACTGAIQSKLFLDCDLSAPTFSTLSFFCPLSIMCLGRLIWEERSHESNSRQHTSLSAEVDRLSIQQQEKNSANDANDDETSHSLNATQNTSVRGRKISTIRAKPEKRNHILTIWSRCPPSTETTEHGHCFIEGTSAVGSNDDVNAQTSSMAKPYSLFGLIPLRSSPRVYATIAAVDVYANYTTILAFKYTTITSVALLDALAIPTAMILSRIFFGRRYTKAHLLGVMVCSIGITMNVLQDYHEDKDLAEAGNAEESAQEQLIEKDYPNKIAGDILAIIGGILFGTANTLQEVTVKDSTLTEYLGCMTFFASIISLTQALIVERDEISAFFSQSSSDTCSQSEGSILFFAFAVGGVVTYVSVGGFLQISDACFLNLSLLTGDAWSVVFSVFGEGIKPPPSFYVALIITVSGVFIYETAPSPVVYSQEEVTGEIQLEEIGSTGREEQNEHDGHVLS